MPSLAELMEDYRNWRGRSEWEQGKAIQDIYGGDPIGQERFERFGGFGTGSHGVGGLAGMIKAYHGSPHAFDKFDMSKIGSGEGAQAYGHGLYFAENPNIANWYRQQLGKYYDRMTTPKGEMSLDEAIKKFHPEGEATSKVMSMFRDKLDVDTFNKVIEDKVIPEIRAKYPESEWENFSPQSGNLYNVELKWPDAAREAVDPLGEHHLLDWDAPLSEQPEGVKSIIGKLSSEMTGPVRESMIGDEYLRHLQSILKFAGRGDEKAETLLNEAGIPGIRYLDQASRNAGYGTHNYVMFDDQFPEIVSRNGVSLSDLLRR